MCAGGIISARVPELYYGAKDEAFGACGSILNLFEENFRHHPKIVGHILEEPCAQLLRAFFAQVRSGGGQLDNLNGPMLQWSDKPLRGKRKEW